MPITIIPPAAAPARATCACAVLMRSSYLISRNTLFRCCSSLVAKMQAAVKDSASRGASKATSGATSTHTQQQQLLLLLLLLLQSKQQLKQQEEEEEAAAAAAAAAAAWPPHRPFACKEGAVGELQGTFHVAIVNGSINLHQHTKPHQKHNQEKGARVKNNAPPRPASFYLSCTHGTIALTASRRRSRVSKRFSMRLKPAATDERNKPVHNDSKACTRAQTTQQTHNNTQ